MSDRKIILYDCIDIYKILDEIKFYFNLDIKFIDKKKELDNLTQEKNIYIVISRKKIDIKNILIVLENLPITIKDLIEKINIITLKKNFNLKSDIKIGKYSLNTNSREIYFLKNRIKLTEQEIKILLYLTNSRRFVKIKELQEKIWGYNINLETHTVETHIHRLKKKIINNFNDDKLIRANRNGYMIDNL